MKFAKFLGTPILKNICERLHLMIYNSDSQSGIFLRFNNNKFSVRTSLTFDKIYISSNQMSCYTRELFTTFLFRVEAEKEL